MSNIVFQNKVADEVISGAVIRCDGAPVPLRFVGTFAGAQIIAHIGTEIGVSKVTLDVTDSEQSTELKMFPGETAFLEITGATGSTNLGCIRP